MVTFDISNPPKYVNMYTHKCMASEQEMQDDRAPWVSALISTIHHTIDINMASIAAKKNM